MGNYSLPSSRRENNALASESDLTGAKFEKIPFRIEDARKRAATEGAPQHPAAARSTSWSSNDRPVAPGRQRLATVSEHDGMEAMPYEHDAIQREKMRRVNDVMRVSSITACGQRLFQWRRNSRSAVSVSRTRRRLERRFWSGHARSLHREFLRKVPPPGVAADIRLRIRMPAPESAAPCYRSGTHTLARQRPGARLLPPDLSG